MWDGMEVATNEAMHAPPEPATRTNGSGRKRRLPRPERQMRNDSGVLGLPEPSHSSAALVTGASAGIGACIAQELAARGQNLVLVARRKDRLQALAKELVARHGIRAETVACDLSKPASRARVPGRITELGLEVEVLVNNAGFATNGPFHESDPARELEQVRVLVEAVGGLRPAGIPAMGERRRGAIP